MSVRDSSQCRHSPVLAEGAKALSVQKEVTLINRFFKKHRIKAHINTELSTFIRGAFMSYTVILDDGGTISSIENRLREMAEHVSWARGKATPVRLRRLPLSLEVPSAKPKPLTPDAGASTLQPFEMLLGQSIGYQGVYDVKLNLLDIEHMLAAGTTGSGKSSLINTMLCTLLWNTPPRKLGIVPIDPKNDDLRPYGEMPHTVASAFHKGRVLEVVEAVFGEKERRIAMDDTSDLPRLFVLVDEWAELYEDREFLAMMASIHADRAQPGHPRAGRDTATACQGDRHDGQGATDLSARGPGTVGDRQQHGQRRPGPGRAVSAGQGVVPARGQRRGRAVSGVFPGQARRAHGQRHPTEVGARFGCPAAGRRTR